MPPAEPPRLTRPHGTRGRVTQDSAVGGILGSLTLLAPPDNENRWRDLSLDSQTLDRMAPADLIELLCDLSPDVSRALWDFLRMCNPGHEAKAYRPGTEEVDPRAQAAVDAFLASLTQHYGSVDVVIGRLYLGAFVRGAFFGELVLDDRGRLPLDLATPDPRWVQFRRRSDSDRGVVWEPFQWQGGQQVSLEAETIRYVPVDPLPGSPYGRSMVAPALWTALFMIGLLHDLRRVVSQQGYPRIDLEIVADNLTKWMPADLQTQAEKARWLEKTIQDAQDAYDALEPDDAWLHPDAIKVNRPVGAVDQFVMSGFDGLIRTLERQAIRALKSIPLLFGVDQGGSETHATRQWEIHVAGIKAIQHLCEQMLEYLLTVALRVQGLQAEVRWRFAEIRAAELLRDAQVEQMQIKNAADRYDRGWISQDSAAQQGAGVEKADAPEPRTASSQAVGNDSNPMDDNPDPGSLREVELLGYPPLFLNGHRNGNGTRERVAS